MITIEVEVTDKVHAMGLYGGSVEQAAERVICRALDERQISELIIDRGPCPASQDGRHFVGCGCD